MLYFWLPLVSRDASYKREIDEQLDFEGNDK